MKRITQATFITSSTCLKNCPDFNLPEIALIGRSNVGKSSFINTLTNRKKLAKTSNTPGKTRLINFFNINEELIIADLPGYGYAKISKTEQQKWSKILEEYLKDREPLKAVIQFIDARHDVQNNDYQMREWLDFHKIYIITLATKTDTLSKNEAFRAIQNISKTLNTEVIEFSSKTGIGKDKILAVFTGIIKDSD
ncbi:MAG TPA: YihA family ribosome biogenesis GTP-binding protein [Cyanobacteria bacterium UBA9971]|nr:YihA family ribosome biogenesis GTP-binding protein [Cyanobacteria bacterium UBA9971]